MTSMFISDGFKTYINTLSTSIKQRYGLENIFSLPNIEFLGKLKTLIGGTYEIRRGLVNSERGDRFTYENIFEDLSQIKGIDDEFIWSGSELFRYVGMVEFFSSKFGVEEPQIFVPGQILKVVSTVKLRGMNLGNLMEHTGKYYQCVSYDMNGNMSSYRGQHVRLKDVYGNEIFIPQRALELTKHTNILELYYNVLRKKIRAEIEDNKKLNTDRLTEEYQQSLRTFMSNAELLHSALGKSIDEEVEAQLQATISFEKSFEKIFKIKSARFIAQEEIEVYTKVLYSEENPERPIGRFRIRIKLRSFDLKILNIDLLNSDTQHPHISSNGSCCLKDWLNPLKKAFENKNYYVMILGIIEYLESYNEGSPYIKREDFIRRNKTKIEHALQVEGQERGKPPVIEKAVRKRRTKAEIEATNQGVARVVETGVDEVSNVNLPSNGTTPVSQIVNLRAEDEMVINGDRPIVQNIVEETEAEAIRRVQQQFPGAPSMHIETGAIYSNQ